MLQVVNKEAQSLLWAFRVSATALSKCLFTGQGILGLRISSKQTHVQSQQQKS